MLKNDQTVQGGEEDNLNNQGGEMSKTQQQNKQIVLFEIEEAEDAIYNQDLTDMADLLVSLVKEEREEAAAMAAAAAPATTRKRKSTS